MEQKHILRKRLLAIIRAAIYGAALFDAMILADNVASESLRGSDGVLSALVALFAYVLAAPCILSGMNTYLVNGLIGGALFGFVAAFWQFGIKTFEKRDGPTLQGDMSHGMGDGGRKPLKKLPRDGITGLKPR